MKPKNKKEKIINKKRRKRLQKTLIVHGPLVASQMHMGVEGMLARIVLL
jgi:hypothetical protein